MDYIAIIHNEIKICNVIFQLDRSDDEFLDDSDSSYFAIKNPTNNALIVSVWQEVSDETLTEKLQTIISAHTPYRISNAFDNHEVKGINRFPFNRSYFLYLIGDRTSTVELLRWEAMRAESERPVLRSRGEVFIDQYEQSPRIRITEPIAASGSSVEYNSMEPNTTYSWTTSSSGYVPMAPQQDSLTEAYERALQRQNMRETMDAAMREVGGM